MWTLKILGDERPLAGWGISAAVLTRVNAGRDLLQLTTTEALSTAPQWGRRKVLELFWSGRRWFWGLVVEPASFAKAGRQGRTYTVEGGSWFLRQLTMTQTWAGEGGPAEYGAMLLFARPGQSVVFHLYQMVALAISEGAYLTYGAYGPGLQPPPERVSNITALNLVQRCMKYMIGSASWFDYTTGGPLVFHCPSYARLRAVTLSAGIEEAEITAEWDRVPTQIIATVKKQTDIPANALPPGQTDGFRTSFYEYATLLRLFPFSAFGRVRVAIDWQEGMVPPDALADYIWNIMGYARFRGKLTYRGATPHPDLRPGVRLNLTGYDPAWASMGALIQQTSLDLFSLATQLTFGPPTHLGPEDIGGLLQRWHRNIVDPQEIAEQDSGVSEDVNYGMGDNTKVSRRKKKGGGCCCSSGGGTSGG